MRNLIERSVNFVTRRAGYQVSRIKPDLGGLELAPDFEPHEVNLIKAVIPYTLTSHERVVSLYRAVRYLSEHQIPGDLVECGVWRGGSVMAIIQALQDVGDTSRHVHLFDTFEGMSAPTRDDVSFEGEVAWQTYKYVNKKIIAVSLEEVRSRILALGYPADKIHFIKGKVEDTLPQAAPAQIALLRLDTDWYESTLHELNHLYPRLTPRGVLIIDDYGHWKGSKKAVDEYFAQHRTPLFLSRIDYSGRLAIKPE